MSGFSAACALVIGILGQRKGIAPLRTPIGDAAAVGAMLAAAHGF